MIILIKNLEFLDEFGFGQDIKSFQYRFFEFIHWKKELKFTDKQSKEEQVQSQTQYFVIIYNQVHEIVSKN